MDAAAALDSRGHGPGAAWQKHLVLLSLSVSPGWGFLMSRGGRSGEDFWHVSNVYVNVNHSGSFSLRLGGGIRAGTLRLAPEQPPALVGEEVDLVQHDLDILALLLEVGPAPLEPGKEFLELLVFVA